MFFLKNRLKIASLRIGKHRIVKNIASLRKVNIAHPYLDGAKVNKQQKYLATTKVTHFLDNNNCTQGLCGTLFSVAARISNAKLSSF